MSVAEWHFQGPCLLRRHVSYGLPAPGPRPAPTPLYSGRSSVLRLCLSTVRHVRLGPFMELGLVICSLDLYSGTGRKEDKTEGTSGSGGFSPHIYSGRF